MRGQVPPDKKYDHISLVLLNGREDRAALSTATINSWKPNMIYRASWVQQAVSCLRQNV